MKTVSYTKMREELADILDYLQEGGELTVTRRNKPDLIVLASTKEDSSSEQEQYVYTKRITSKGRIIHAPKDGFFKIKVSNERLSFDEALKETKVRHAKTIKALGDK